MSYKYCIFYDYGHGGVSPEGKYTTAPSKQFKHTNGKQYHGDGWFYEGVKNRKYGQEVVRLLREQGINVVEVSHAFKDTDLYDRVLLANEYHARIQPGIYISEHSNAIVGPSVSENKTARGFSIWTSEGQTTSDKLAEKFHSMYKEAFTNDVKKVKTLSQLTDGDNDYEANFYVLRETKMPAVLMENLFFDNPEDADVLMSDDYFHKYCTLQANWILWAIENLG